MRFQRITIGFIVPALLLAGMLLLPRIVMAQSRTTPMDLHIYLQESGFFSKLKQPSDVPRSAGEALLAMLGNLPLVAGDTLRIVTFSGDISKKMDSRISAADQRDAVINEAAGNIKTWVEKPIDKTLTFHDRVLTDIAGLLRDQSPADTAPRIRLFIIVSDMVDNFKDPRDAMEMRSVTQQNFRAKIAGSTETAQINAFWLSHFGEGFPKSAIVLLRQTQASSVPPPAGALKDIYDKLLGGDLKNWGVVDVPIGPGGTATLATQVPELVNWLARLPEAGFTVERLAINYDQNAGGWGLELGIRAIASGPARARHIEQILIGLSGGGAVPVYNQPTDLNVGQAPFEKRLSIDYIRIQQLWLGNYQGASNRLFLAPNRTELGNPILPRQLFDPIEPLEVFAAKLMPRETADVAPAGSKADLLQLSVRQTLLTPRPIGSLMLIAEGTVGTSPVRDTALLAVNQLRRLGTSELYELPPSEAGDPNTRRRELTFVLPDRFLITAREIGARRIQWVLRDQPNPDDTEHMAHGVFDLPPSRIAVDRAVLAIGKDATAVIRFRRAGKNSNAVPPARVRLYINQNDAPLIEGKTQSQDGFLEGVVPRVDQDSVPVPPETEIPITPPGRDFVSADWNRLVIVPTLWMQLFDPGGAPMLPEPVKVEVPPLARVDIQRIEQGKTPDQIRILLLPTVLRGAPTEIAISQLATLAESSGPALGGKVWLKDIQVDPGATRTDPNEARPARFFHYVPVKGSANPTPDEFEARLPIPFVESDTMEPASATGSRILALVALTGAESERGQLDLPRGALGARGSATLINAEMSLELKSLWPQLLPFANPHMVEFAISANFDPAIRLWPQNDPPMFAWSEDIVTSGGIHMLQNKQPDKAPPETLGRLRRLVIVSAPRTVANDLFLERLKDAQLTVKASVQHPFADPQTPFWIESRQNIADIKRLPLKLNFLFGVLAIVSLFPALTLVRHGGTIWGTISHDNRRAKRRLKWLGSQGLAGSRARTAWLSLINEWFTVLTLIIAMIQVGIAISDYFSDQDLSAQYLQISTFIFLLACAVHARRFLLGPIRPEGAPDDRVSVDHEAFDQRWTWFRQTVATLLVIWFVLILFLWALFGHSIAWERWLPFSSQVMMVLGA